MLCPGLLCWSHFQRGFIDVVICKKSKCKPEISAEKTIIELCLCAAALHVVVIQIELTSKRRSFMLSFKGYSMSRLNTKSEVCERQRSCQMVVIEISFFHILVSIAE